MRRPKSCDQGATVLKEDAGWKVAGSKRVPCRDEDFAKRISQVLLCRFYCDPKTPFKRLSGPVLQQLRSWCALGLTLTVGWNNINSKFRPQSQFPLGLQFSAVVWNQGHWKFTSQSFVARRSWTSCRCGRPLRGSSRTPRERRSWSGILKNVNNTPI